MAESEKKWYVLRSVSGKENKVKEYLESEIKKTDLGKYVSQVLIPTEKTYTVRNGKKVMKERAYLPGYVLIEAELVGEVIHQLKNINYVAGFLPNTTNPQPLSEIEVKRILGTMDELEEAGDELDVKYYVGENVKVTSGPFSSFSGVVEEVNDERKKLKVMVKIFGRAQLLELGYMQVEKE
ncbi:MAG TPA: transcription termination/antitermination factor NusG [Porphyromonadaceae bacterium]|jgi:transcriptional antiterminator NusG|uniref:Transcription termination/antitermination protein NusG n=1 Tax=bioreactor metagenome TaxID=1076179 RepID=A0A645FF69_9ZZZZ|nr:transcription termination/antitermination protein NusG [Petrimonas sp.]OJV38538.1 MAG: transcription termination/antitermination factor NusG [Bacteroidia bacterium 43-41]BBD46410.1 transcription termination/antitermination factorNusG [Petrimonas sp. IBARAKI]HAC73576.1 transcription termination/antitermination factor NusG [Porphyromonadaceae bacterium]MDD3542023.1 transcription termination/antitermination protein NusG [Petrimonas sp.]